MRHDGLLDINPNSSKALKEWYLSGHGGGHPWEILRGGNTTHIDLGIHFVENKGWEIYLNAEATSRLIETARIALQFIKLKLPFKLLSGKSIKDKLLLHDNIGIVSDWFSTHRASSSFSEGLQVYDCIHLNLLETEEQKAIASLITWFPLEISLPNL
jgi:hypothetical protein